MIDNRSTTGSKSNRILSPQFEQFLSKPLTQIAFSLGILLLDLATGPFLQFPILFVLPVLSAAWYRSFRFALVFSIVLPIGRLIIAEYEDASAPVIYLAINCVIRIFVLTTMAYLTARTARQNRELNQQVDTLVTICAWSRMVEYQGGWISFEEYLRRRFNIRVSHGVSPEELKKLREHPRDPGSPPAK